MEQNNRILRMVRIAMICLTIGAILLGLMGNNAALAAPKQSRPGGTATVQLTDIDSGLTSPSGVYRWLDENNRGRVHITHVAGSEMALPLLSLLILRNPQF